MLLHTESGTDFRGENLGFYYGDFRKCLHNYELDQNGIAILIVNPDAPDAQRRSFNPCLVAEYAIIEYENYLRTKKEEHRVSFQKHADWLVDNATLVDNDKACLYYHYDTPKEKAPWGSGISQGIGISALLRAYQHFGESRYFEVAIRLFNMMDVAVEQGGFRFGDERFPLWYEESNDNRHILNGHIYSLLGTYDLYRVTRDPLYKKRFEDGVQTIKKNISSFDMGFHTKYDSVAHCPANHSYHSIHITLFRILYNITGDSFFLNCAERFKDYHERPAYRLRAFAYILKFVLSQKLLRLKRPTEKLSTE
jgi:hypothetical protein